ncbi:MAG TPA: hypothetical protein VGP28_01405 [Methylocella sp.]|nr:hypothetical protein [Methylocella sp.]
MLPELAIITLTQRSHSSIDAPRDRPGENEGKRTTEGCVITPEMVDAGKSAFFTWDASNDPYSANCVIAVYQAMVKAKQIRDQ